MSKATQQFRRCQSTRLRSTHRSRARPALYLIAAKVVRGLSDMKIKGSINTKSIQLDKAEQTILGVVVGATIVTIFCLTSAKVLLNQALYQRRVINARNDSAKQLDADVTAASTLNAQY